jgi:hypothetical protein
MLQHIHARYNRKVRTIGGVYSLSLTNTTKECNIIGITKAGSRTLASELPALEPPPSARRADTRTIVTQSHWEDDTYTHHDATRQLWSETVAEIADKATATLPECASRIERAVDPPAVMTSCTPYPSAREGRQASGVQGKGPCSPQQSLPCSGTGAAGAVPSPLGGGWWGKAQRPCERFAAPRGDFPGAWQPCMRRGPPAARVDRSADCSVDWRTMSSERSEQCARALHARHRPHDRRWQPAVAR